MQLGERIILFDAVEKYKRGVIAQARRNRKLDRNMNAKLHTQDSRVKKYSDMIGLNGTVKTGWHF